jgi:hypothetical protein
VADGEPYESPELKLLANMGKYGVDAVMGRTLSYHEILCLNTADAIVSAYNEKFSSKDWVEWEQNNPGKARLLNEAMRLANGEEPN